MEIEEGPQCNCSELVARLYPVTSDIDRIRDQVQHIVNATGWNLGVQARGELQPDFDDISKAVEWNLKGNSGERKEVFYPMSVEDIILGSRMEEPEIVFPIEEIDPPLDQFFKDHSYGDEDHCWVNLQDSDGLTIEDVRTMEWPIKIGFHDGYCRSGLQMKSGGDYCKDHYEPLAKAVGQLGGEWHCHDGGSPDGFVQWLENNGYEDIKKMTNRRYI